MFPRFLSTEAVLRIHRDQIERYGGSLGVRDEGLLQAATAMPRATFEGRYLHNDIYSMAAAYLYHIVMDHPFVDGNKRVGFVSAAVFLEVNGIEIVAEQDQVVALVLAVIRGDANKENITTFLRQHSNEVAM